METAMFPKSRRWIRFLGTLGVFVLLVWFYRGKSSAESVPALAAPSVQDDNTLRGWVKFTPSTSAVKTHEIHRNKAPLTSNDQYWSSYDCLDQLYSAGQICKRASADQNLKLDVVYAFQNGTDHLQATARNYYLADVGATGHMISPVRHYREHNELLYSLRSIVSSFPPSTISNVHLYTTDLLKGGERIGQVPYWLNLDHLYHLTTRIKLVFPRDAYRSSAFSHELAASAWRRRALPVFNSMAVESQLHNIQTEQDNFIYQNDDFFFFRNVSYSDFFSPLYGQVFRLQRDLVISANPPVIPANSGKRDGEWPSLFHTQRMLNKRFYTTNRFYPMHLGKTYNRAILQEVEATWANALAETGAVRVRGRGNKDETNLAFLYINYVVERHREAMLWSFIVAKLDLDRDGQLSPSEMDLLVATLQLADDAPQPQESKRRSDVMKEYIEESTTLPPARETDLVFFSFDGYLHTDKHVGVSPNCTDIVQVCMVNLLEDMSLDSDDVFKRFAFAMPQCGNCLIKAVIASTDGLSGFLPSPSKTDTDPVPTDYVPVLSTLTEWQDADYSLQTILQHSSNLRTSCLRLLHRYSYAIGDTRFQFIKMARHSQVQRVLNSWINIEGRKPALAVLNDDIWTPDAERVDTFLAAWFKRMWPQPLEWEKV